ncbi:MAG TPA: carbamoyl-phosphate synthase domain-containing protein, partial [Rhodopila sp.]
MPISTDHIIERLGGADAAARLTGVGTEAVRKWRQSRSIPSRHWPAVVAATGLTMADLQSSDQASAPMSDATTVPPAGATAVLVLADGTEFWGRGFGAHTSRTGLGVHTPRPREATHPDDRARAAGKVGEVCFSTGMTGYQETLTDPSFAGQIITFTFPHIGNVGTNRDDIEATTIAARGLVVKQDITEPSNWRSTQTLQSWLRAQGVTGIAGVDTRTLT